MATPEPSSAAPGPAGTESRCAERSTAGPAPRPGSAGHDVRDRRAGEVAVAGDAIGRPGAPRRASGTRRRPARAPARSPPTRRGGGRRRRRRRARARRCESARPAEKARAGADDGSGAGGWSPSQVAARTAARRRSPAKKARPCIGGHSVTPAAPRTAPETKRGPARGRGTPGPARAALPRCYVSCVPGPRGSRPSCPSVDWMLIGLAQPAAVALELPGALPPPVRCR